MLEDMTDRTSSRWRLFVGAVYALIGAAAAITAIVGIVLLISGNAGAGIIWLIIAAVLAVMAWSTGRSFRAL